MRPAPEPVGARSPGPTRHRRILGPGILCVIVALAACSTEVVAPLGSRSDGADSASRTEAETMTATAGSDGSAFIDLPARLGTLERPPTLVCSYTPDGQNWWFAFGDKACFIERVLADGSLRVRIGGLEPGWTFRVDAIPDAS
jgi:hypothetical protein